MFIVSANGRLADANAAFEAFLGLSLDELRGVSFSGGPIDPPAGPQGQAAALAPPPEALLGIACRKTILLPIAGGEPKLARAEYHPHHTSEGRLSYLFCTIAPTTADCPAPEAPSQRLSGELAELRARFLAAAEPLSVLGRGPRHERLLAQIRNVASARSHALVAGEPGTGRRTVAHAIHLAFAPDVADRELVAIDCRASDPEHLESELFRDRDRERPRIKASRNATLLLVDPECLPRDLQDRLARACEHDEAPAILAASASNLSHEFQREMLTPEYFYLLTRCVIETTPLRRRLEELPMLAQHLLERANAVGRHRRAGLSDESIEILKAYDWPGNLAELKRVIDDAHAGASGSVIEPKDLPAAIQGHLAGAYLPPPIPFLSEPLDDHLATIERGLIERALKTARGNKSKAAELLGLTRPRLYRRMSELGLADTPEPESEP